MSTGWRNVYRNTGHNPLQYSPTERVAREILIALGFKEGIDFSHE